MVNVKWQKCEIVPVKLFAYTRTLLSFSNMYLAVCVYVYICIIINLYVSFDIQMGMLILKIIYNLECHVQTNDESRRNVYYVLGELIKRSRKRYCKSFFYYLRICD